MVAVFLILKNYWLIITLFILATITAFSLTPLEMLPPAPGGDKTHHFIAYGALMFPVALRKPVYWLWIAVFFICWSGAIELLQPYVNRHAEWLDLAANIAGMVCGLLIARLVRWRINI